VNGSVDGYGVGGAVEGQVGSLRQTDCSSVVRPGNEVKGFRI